jgi:hypothetical protein
MWMTKVEWVNRKIIHNLMCMINHIMNHVRCKSFRIFLFNFLMMNHMMNHLDYYKSGVKFTSLNHYGTFPLRTWLFPTEQLKPFFILRIFFIHFIHGWKNNLRKGSNPRPLGHMGDFNYCINFYPLK